MLHGGSVVAGQAAVRAEREVLAAWAQVDKGTCNPCMGISPGPDIGDSGEAAPASHGSLRKNQNPVTNVLRMSRPGLDTESI